MDYAEANTDPADREEYMSGPRSDSDVAFQSWLFPGPIPSCRSHRGPQGPNEDLAQCPHCGAPTFALRPDWETFGHHLPDCALPRRHYGHCESGGEGHPQAEVIRGFWPGAAS